MDKHPDTTVDRDQPLSDRPDTDSAAIVRLLHHLAPDNRRLVRQLMEAMLSPKAKDGAA
jgi:hypothetical protein